jgi:hypothetical protein
MCGEGTACPAGKQGIVNCENPKKGPRLGNGCVCWMHGHHAVCSGDEGVLRNVVLEDEGTMLLGNSGKHEPSASHHRRVES